MATPKRGTGLAKSPARPRTPAIVEEAATVITTLPTVADIAAAVKGRYKLFYDGPEDGGSILANAITSATSGADLFAASELEKVNDHLGETLVIQSLDAVRNSDFEEAGGLGIYLIVTATDVDGVLMRLGVGSADAVGKIVALAELDSLPWAVAFERSTKATRAGYFPINLVSRQVAGGGQPF